ncbi:MAG: VWA domain-containing protein [Hyphomicrobiales bacterium]|nr:VWA domain-containing protein [Hyphomicrobiales bacterium]
MPLAFGSMVTWAGCIANGYPCSAVAQLNLDRASQLCPDGREMLDAYWPRILQLHTHRDVMDMAFDIAAECADLYYKDPQQQNQPNQQAPQPPQGAPQQSAGNGSPQQQPQGSPGQGPCDQQSSDPGASGQNPDATDPTDTTSPPPADDQAQGAGPSGPDQAKQNGAASNQPQQSTQSQNPADNPSDTEDQSTDNSGGPSAGPDQTDQNGPGASGSQNSPGNNAPGDQQADAGGDGGSHQQNDADNAPSDPGTPPTQSGARQPAQPNTPNNGGSAPTPKQVGQAPCGGDAGAASQGQGSNGSQPAPPRSPGMNADDIDTDTLDVGDVIAQISQQTGDDDDEDQQALVNVTVAPERDIAAYHRLIASSGAASARVAQATRKIFMSETHRRERFQLEDGDLDLSNLIGISTGSADIYSRRDARRDRAAAVCFNLDLSSSMLESKSGKRRLDHLAEAAAVLASAIGSDRDIHTAALTYTSLPQEHLIKWVKRFSDPPSALKGAIGAIPADDDNGGTPTHFGLLEAQKALRSRPEKRKILILITDGEASDPDRTLQAAHGVMRAGILLVGIGIGPNAPAMAIPGWTRIKDTSELGAKLTEIVSNVLQQHKWAA